MRRGAPAYAPCEALKEDSSVSTDSTQRKQEYIKRVTRGEGFMPWQKQEHVSYPEVEFREVMEKRKEDMLARRTTVKHPIFLTEKQIDQARRNIQNAEWAGRWFENIRTVADHVAGQSGGYIEHMVPELTPTNPYGLTCPNCVGKKSQEGLAYRSIEWDYRTPDLIRCSACGQTYPDPDYPETAQLICPRTGQTFTYYFNDEERKHPEDRSGKYAWKWVGKPIHASFTGFMRGQKIGFMTSALRSLALSYRFMDDPKYAETALRILERLAACYRNWLYHDFYDTVADCDPLYAAWNAMTLKLEWKRHLSAMAYGNSRYETGPVNDTFGQAKMLATYFGCGRIHPSVDGISSHLIDICLAYDLVHDATDGDGKPIWTEEKRARIEKGLILEYINTAEPFVGGIGNPPDLGNKSPSVYRAQAAVGRCLGLSHYADAALRGYEGLRDKSFIYDGFSKESPSYTNMYLTSLIWIPETLHGFRWPKNIPGRTGAVNLYKTDPKLRLILQATVDQLRPDGRYLPLSDTVEDGEPRMHIFEIGLKRYPRIFSGKLHTLYRGRTPTEYAILNLDAAKLEKTADLDLPEILFPAWMTAVLRHGSEPDATVLALPFNPPGGHRQADNLSLYYVDCGQTVLGELGYVGDSPMNAWVRGTTLSHNLVIVDDQEQRFQAEGQERKPGLRFMATSPRVSVVEASSKVYPQCTGYRRLVALIKGPGAQTVALDLFRVRGGNKHAYRLFSELAASDSDNGGLEFTNLAMPPEPPLPNFGSSIDREHIFGLRDTRRVEHPPPSWQAVWKQTDRQYRLHMLSQVNAVEASNGPGQETLEQIGRRVRFLDAVNTGKDLSSTFVVLHEPSGPQQAMPVQNALCLAVPEQAGPDAVAVCIESDWGTCWVFSDVEGEVEIDGIRFQGTFGVYGRTPQNRSWYFTIGASTLQHGESGFAHQPAAWSGRVVGQTEIELQSDTPAPDGWPPLPKGAATWVAVDTESYRTGFPVATVQDNRIGVERFPLQPATAFELLAVKYAENEFPT